MASRYLVARYARSTTPKAFARVVRAAAPAARLNSTVPENRKADPTPPSTNSILPIDPTKPRHPGASLAPSTPSLKQHLTLADRLALRFRNYLPNTTETYIAYDVTRDLYTECGLQAAYTEGVDFSTSAKFWYQTCNRPPTFQSWYQVTVLHMWMIAARMRAIEKGRVSIWQQHFIDHFFYDSEDKMVKRYGIKSAGQRGGYMKDLYHQYRGMTAAFDEGLMMGDAVLATAIWRNIFNAADDVDMEVLAMATSHVRRVLSKLGTIDDDVILNGRVRFGLPTEEVEVVKEESHFLETVTEATPEEASAA